MANEQRNPRRCKILGLINQQPGDLPRGFDSDVGGDYEDEDIEEEGAISWERSEEEDVWTRCVPLLSNQFMLRMVSN
jgi:hypothetical protein